MLAALIALVLASPLAPTRAAADDWQLTLAPYLWAVSMQGDIGARGTEVDIDASFRDIVDESDSSLAFNSEIALHNGTFGFAVDTNFSQLGVDNVANGTPLQSDVTADLWFVEVVAKYRLADTTDSAASRGGTAFTLDGYAGARYTKLETEIDLDNGGSRSADKDWWDPVIGGDATIDLSPRWFVRTQADIGGFGAGSDMAALAAGTIGYRFNMFGRSAAVAIGYRSIWQDYDEGGTDGAKWSMNLHGPTLGLVTHWGGAGRN
jgi:hypothetical protein